jgi:hypothetical protein
MIKIESVPLIHVEFAKEVICPQRIQKRCISGIVDDILKKKVKRGIDMKKPYSA